jgi:uncharacterized protein YsxB (DUF464 family)
MSNYNGNENQEPDDFFAWLPINYDDHVEAKELVPNAISFDRVAKSWYLKEDYADHHDEFLNFIEEKKKSSSRKRTTVYTPEKKRKLSNPGERQSSSSFRTNTGDSSTPIVSRANHFDLAKSKDSTIKNLITKSAEKILEVNPSSILQIQMIKDFADSGFQEFNASIMPDMIKAYYGAPSMEEAKIAFCAYFSSSIHNRMNALQEEKNKRTVVETPTEVPQNNQQTVNNQMAEMMKLLQNQMTQQLRALEQKLNEKVPRQTTTSTVKEEQNTFPIEAATSSASRVTVKEEQKIIPIEAATSSAYHSSADSTSRVAPELKAARVAAEAEVARAAAEAESARITAELEAARVAEAKESHGSRKKKGT